MMIVGPNVKAVIEGRDDQDGTIQVLPVEAVACIINEEPSMAHWQFLVGVKQAAENFRTGGSE